MTTIAKGEWWRLFADPVLDRLESQVAVSNQTIKADEANHQTALALIAEARAGLLPTINFDPSFTRVQTGDANCPTSSTPRSAARWALDVWGKMRRAVEQDSAAAEASAADLADARWRRSRRWRSTMSSCGVRFARRPARRHGQAYKRSLDITHNQYNAGAAAKSDVITASADCATRSAGDRPRRRAGAVRARHRRADWPAAGRILDRAAAARARRSGRAGPACPRRCSSAAPTSPRPSARWPAANARSASPSPAYYPNLTLIGLLRLSGDPFSGVCSTPRTAVVATAGSRPDRVRRRAARRPGRGGEGDLRQDVATYRQTVLDRLPAGRGPAGRAAHPGAASGRGPGRSGQARPRGGATGAQRVSRRHRDLHRGGDRPGDRAGAAQTRR